MRPELIEATSLLRSKDSESVGKAISLLQKTVYAFSMKVCGHPEDAEDTMQDVLIGSLPHLAKISDPRALAVWLYTVTRNRCWRTRRRGVHAPKQILSLDELMPDESELEALPDAGASPERLVLQGEQNDLLHQAILSIPPEYRIVLVLHDVEDLDTEQIGLVLDLLPGTVRVRLHRARLYVRKAMSQLVGRTSEQQLLPDQKLKRLRKKSVSERPGDCKEIFANLSEYLDDRLSASSCEQMRLHIEACPACIMFIESLRNAIDRCRRLDVACDPEIAPKLRALLTKEYLRLLGTPIRQKKSSRL